MERLLDWSIKLAVAALIGVVVLMHSSPEAHADHPTWEWDGMWHLYSMHRSDLNEDYCVWSQDPAMPQQTAYDRVTETLWNNSETYDWDSIAHDGNFYRLWWSPKLAPCNEYSSADRANIEVEYQVFSLGPCNPYSCAEKSRPVIGPYGHVDYLKYTVYLRTSHISGSPASYHHTINHETGHVVGFDDGAGSHDCPDSVMHSLNYGCGINREWVSPGDRHCAHERALNSRCGFVPFLRYWSGAYLDHFYTQYEGSYWSYSREPDCCQIFDVPLPRRFSHPISGPRSPARPVYQLWNWSWGDHLYTSYEPERDFLIGQGWEYQGIAGYCFSARYPDPQPVGTVPLYRLWYGPWLDHLYTTSVSERDYLISQGWTYEHIECYMPLFQ